MDVTQLLPQFGNLAFTLLAFVVALSVIVAIHEYGHYIVGRWTGIHAEVFSLGFGPVLFARTDRRGTRWQVAALPLGGFVKFLGDANAASVGGDATGLTPAQRRTTMLGAPLWARAATVAAGPVANFLLAIAVFLGVILSQGQPSEPLTVAEIAPLPAGTVQGLMTGDEILAIGGRDVAVVGDLATATDALATGAVVDYTIRRDSEPMTVQAPRPDVPVIKGVALNSAAWDVEVKPGDVVLSIDGEAIDDADRIIEIVEASEGRSLLFEIWRDGRTLAFTLVPRRTDLPAEAGGFETDWKVGLSLGSPFFSFETETPGLGTAVREAVGQLGFILTSSLSGFWSMITGAISTCNLSGPVGIAETSGAMASQGVMAFLWFLAVLSAAVGLMNLFPIPVLDGGHLVFHAWEAVTGHPPGDRALRVLMTAGLSVILTLMLFAIANDLFLCP